MRNLGFHSECNCMSDTLIEDGMNVDRLNRKQNGTEANIRVSAKS